MPIVYIGLGVLVLVVLWLVFRPKRKPFGGESLLKTLDWHDGVRRDSGKKK